MFQLAIVPDLYKGVREPEPGPLFTVELFTSAELITLNSPSSCLSFSSARLKKHHIWYYLCTIIFYIIVISNTKNYILKIMKKFIHM